MADIVIQNATIIDGSGSKRYNDDLVINDGIVTMIGDASKISADKKINAFNKIVCPGFIDIHSHLDLSIYRKDHPKLFEPLIRQGITTAIGGNCGLSVAPIKKNRFYPYQQFYLEAFTEIDDKDLEWDSFGNYLNYLENSRVALNIGMLIPHGMIRLQVMGKSNEFAEDEDIASMRRIIQESMEAGAFGLSTGLQYFPGLFSNHKELTLLARELRKYDGRFTSHLRSYTSSTLFKALDEVVDVARDNDIHLQVSHIFSIPWAGLFQRLFMGGVRFFSNHPMLGNFLIPPFLVQADMKKIMKYMENKKKQGIRMGMDVMPTTTGFTHLFAFFPPWVLNGTKSQVLESLQEKNIREKIIKDIKTGKPIWPHNKTNTFSLNIFKLFGWDGVRIMAVESQKNKPLEGRKLSDIAKEKGKHPIEAACDLLLEENGKVLVYETIGEPDDAFTERSTYPAIKHPDVSIVTDTILNDFSRPSYLFYGCYPRFLGEYVREKNLLTLEEAIRKITSLPADSIGLKGRGLIQEGNWADIVIFDPKTINRACDFYNPACYPEGLEYTIINGKIAWNKGTYDDKAFAGQVLRRQ